MSEGEWRSGGGPAETGELRLARPSIEELASHLAELLAAAGSGPPEPPRQLTAAEVSRLWRIRRRWVYEHSDELGARRLGQGPRPRLRFDPEEVAERLGRPPAERPARRDVRGSRRYAADSQSGSLCASSRASVERRHGKRPGRRANAPRPGAEQAAQ